MQPADDSIQPIDPIDPIAQAIDSLQRLAEAFARRRRDLAAEVGLTEAQWRLLEELARRDDFMPSLFARSRDVSPAAVSRTLRQLQDAGWVRASLSSADGRQRDYQVTGAGRSLLQKIDRERERAIDAVWRQLPTADLHHFARIGDAIARRLESLE